jgi:chorismate synthase
MNNFGRIFTVQIFGASHAAVVGVTINGVPPGIILTEEDFMVDLARRKGLSQRGTTPRKEEDMPIFQSGIFNQRTTGAPLQIIFENKNIRSKDYSNILAIPRPSHADWVAHQKYQGFEDYRGGGAFSARLTAGIVAAGVVAKKTIQEYYQVPLQITTSFKSVGGKPTEEEGIAHAIQLKDSVGAILHCSVTNVPIGLGEPFWDSVESVIAHAIFAIPAVKGIEFGAGFEASNMTGTQHNDVIICSDGTTATNNAGGVVGGLTNGNDINFNIAFKPTASTPKEQTSFNFETNQMESFSIKGRHDLCVALRAPVIVEAMTYICLLDLYMVDNAIQRHSTKGRI